MVRKEIQYKAEEYKPTVNTSNEQAVKMVIFKLRQACGEMIKYSNQIEVDYTRESIEFVIEDLQDMIGDCNDR